MNATFDYRQEFLEFAIKNNILRFGEFITKAGRTSPYFFNAGLFNTGYKLQRLGEFYARAISDSEVHFDMLFGPAYKGIPLVSAVSIGLLDLNDDDIPFAFNRKEAKDHGEGGNLVGSELKGNVLIIDDVISAGTSVRESVEIIQKAGAKVAGVVIAIDRMEKGKGELSAVQEVQQQFGIPVLSIANLNDLLKHLEHQPELKRYEQAVRAYREQYGA